MATVAYKVEPSGGEWSVARDGRRGMNYASRSAAYEVAVAEAEGDLRQGRDVVIEVLCGDESASQDTRPGVARAD
jgi:hypothetical protein